MDSKVNSPITTKEWIQHLVVCMAKIWPKFLIQCLTLPLTPNEALFSPPWMRIRSLIVTHFPMNSRLVTFRIWGRRGPTCSQLRWACKDLWLGNSLLILTLQVTHWKVAVILITRVISIRRVRSNPQKMDRRKKNKFNIAQEICIIRRASNQVT